MDPATIAYIIAAIAAAAGTGAQLHSNKKVIEAQADAQARDRFQQAELQRQSDEEIRRQLANVDPTKLGSDVEQAVQQRTAATVQPSAPPPAQYQAAPAAAPKEVSSDLGRRLTGAQAEARGQAESEARLAAFGDASQQTDRDIARIGERIRRFQRESRGFSNLVPWNMRAAGDQGYGSQNTANVANLLSDIGFRWATTRGGAPGGGQPPAPSYNTGVF